MHTTVCSTPLWAVPAGQCAAPAAPAAPDRPARGAAPTHLGVLCQADVHQGLGCWVHDVQGLHDGRPIIAHRHRALSVHELVHAAGAQRGAHHVCHCVAGVDVADQLRLALARVRAILEQDDLRLLQGGGSKGARVGRCRQRMAARRGGGWAAPHAGSGPSPAAAGAAPSAPIAPCSPSQTAFPASWRGARARSEAPQLIRSLTGC